MKAPFYPSGAFSDGTSLAIAFAIGIAFGFVLERAGFGSSRKLVSQFYLNDLAVFKVMFTAIVTAMLGLYVLGRIGFIDLSLVSLVPTNLWPDVVGGLVLGAGFVVGGYCPGTSLVGVATGRGDAVVYAAGVAAGSLVVGEAWPLIKGFYESSALGALRLPEVFHLPTGGVVALVVVVALAGFRGAEWVEKRFAPGASAG